jgi:uncharacterized membrane protein
MREMLANLFLPICGQYAPHVWAPDGLALPCCQRCTGLYMGAVIALLLQVILRPRPTAAWRWLHAALLLQIVPLGLHWLPQGPVLRSWSGLWLGFAAVFFLWAAPGRWFAAGVFRFKALVQNSSHDRVGGRGLYLGVLAVSMLLVPLAGVHGGTVGGVTLAASAVAGVITLALLALANLALAAVWLARLSIKGAERGTP